MALEGHCCASDSNRGVSPSVSEYVCGGGKVLSAIWRSSLRRSSSRLLEVPTWEALRPFSLSTAHGERAGSPRGGLLHQPAAIETHKFVKTCLLLRKPERQESVPTPTRLAAGAVRVIDSEPQGQTICDLHSTPPNDMANDMRSALNTTSRGSHVMPFVVMFFFSTLPRRGGGGWHTRQADHSSRLPELTCAVLSP